MLACWSLDLQLHIPVQILGQIVIFMETQELNILEFNNLTQHKIINLGFMKSLGNRHSAIGDLPYCLLILPSEAETIPVPE